MIKLIVILALLAAGFSSNAGGKFPVFYGQDKNGSPTFRVVNQTRQWVYCVVTDSYGYGPDFEIAPGKSSRWHYVPSTTWVLDCK